MSGSPASASFHRLAEQRSAVQRLFGQFEAELGNLPPWAADVLASLRRMYDAGSLPGAIWVDHVGGPVGFGVWNAPVEVGRRQAWLYLAPEFRTERRLANLLDALQGWNPDDGPIVSVNDLIPGCALDVQSTVFGARGFHRAGRRDMTFPAEAANPPPSALPLRNVGERDSAAVLDLMLAAYATAPVEQALFAERRDRRTDAAEATTALLEGGLGPFWPEASFAREDGGRLLGATLVNEFHGPLITEVMVRPEARRQGTARALVGATVRAIRSRDPRPPRLVVTEENTPAVRLYRSVGFVDVPDVAGGVWLDLARLAYPPDFPATGSSDTAIRPVAESRDSEPPIRRPHLVP